jgi:hypothetical protein
MAATTLTVSLELSRRLPLRQKTLQKQAKQAPAENASYTDQADRQ